MTKSLMLYWIVAMCLMLAIYIPLTEIIFDDDGPPMALSVAVGALTAFAAIWFWESRQG